MYTRDELLSYAEIYQSIQLYKETIDPSVLAKWCICLRRIYCLGQWGINLLFRQIMWSNSPLSVSKDMLTDQLNRWLTNFRQTNYPSQTANLCRRDNFSLLLIWPLGFKLHLHGNFNFNVKNSDMVSKFGPWISPYCSNTLPIRQVMRIQKVIK